MNRTRADRAFSSQRHDRDERLHWRGIDPARGGDGRADTSANHFGAAGRVGRGVGSRNGGTGPAEPPPALPANLPAPDQWFGLYHRDCRVPTEWLKELTRFKHLHTLDLGTSYGSATPVSDTSVNHIARMTQLRVLSIGGADISD